MSHPLKFERFAVIVTVAIVLVQLMSYNTRGAASIVVVPVRPALVRDAGALTIADDVGPVDGARLRSAFEDMDRDAALKLTPRQKQAVLSLVRQLDGGRALQPSEADAAAFRTRFMGIALDMAGDLSPMQARFVVEHGQSLNIQFEASYWQTLEKRLSADAR